MHIDFTGQHLEVTDALRNYTIEKFGRLERHFSRITAIKVRFHVEHLTRIAEATILLSKTELHARASDDDMYKSVDLLTAKLDRQICQHKDKIKHHREKHRD